MAGNDAVLFVAGSEASKRGDGASDKDCVTEPAARLAGHVNLFFYFHPDDVGDAPGLTVECARHIGQLQCCRQTPPVGLLQPSLTRMMNDGGEVVLMMMVVVVAVVVVTTDDE